MSPLQRFIRNGTRLLTVCCLVSLPATIVHSACLATFPELGEPGIQIDGRVDPAWDTAEWHSIDQLLMGSAPSGNVFSARWAGMWDSRNGKLMLMVEVIDASGIVRDSGGSSWEDDNIELYFDGDYSRSSGYDGQNDFQFRILPNAQGGELYVSGAAFSANIGYHTLVMENGYRLEMALPLSGLGIAPADATDTLFGLEIQVTNDTDGGNRDIKLGWCAASDLAWKDPSSFGTGEIRGTSTTPVEEGPYPVRLASSPGGSIQLYPGTGPHDPGSEVRIRAIPDAGYRFVGWRGDVAGKRNPRTLYVNSAKDIAALFVPLSQGNTVFAMNAGSIAYTDRDGIVYQENTYSNPRSSGRGHGNPVSGTDDPGLFNRYQVAADKLIYSIPLTAGVYEVDLMWAAPQGQPSGMGVSLAGELVEHGGTGLDVYMAAGGYDKALVRTYTVDLSDDFLRLVLFRSGTTEPFIHAIRVREPEPQAENQPPRLETVDVPGVLGEDLIIPAEVFEAGFLDPEGDLLAGIQVASLPQHGMLLLNGEPVSAGQWIPYENLGNLLYRSDRQSQGRDFWHWRAHDGSSFSNTAAPVHIFMRAGRNRVTNLLVATWDTFQWPFFAYYPERDVGLVGLDGVARDGNSCGPTARAHINYHWKHPLRNMGTLCFEDSGGMRHDFPYSFSPYNYHEMPPSVSDQTPVSEVPDSLARLMADNHGLGVDVYGSGFNTWEAMPAFQGFDDSARMIAKGDLTDAQWIKTLKHDLNMGRLLMLGGESDTGGHWWIVSGYDANDRFYTKLNYGNIEGYYPADNFAGYYKNLAVIAELQPKELGNMLLYAPAPENPETLDAGQPVLIEWFAARAGSVDVLYSLTNGATWEPVRRNVPTSKGKLLWRTPPVAATSLLFRVVNGDGENLETYNDYADSAACDLGNPPVGEWLQGGGDVFSSFKGIGWHVETGPGTIRTLGGLNLFKFSDTIFHHQTTGWLISKRHVGGISWVYSPIHGWLGISDLAEGYAYHFETRSWVPLP